MNIFDQLEERAKQSQKEWDEIDALIDLAKNQLEKDKENSFLTEQEKILTNIVIRLASSLKPMGNVSDIKQMTSDIDNLLNNLKNKK